MIAARQPKRVPAHWTPRLMNICFENNGNAAATADRIIVLAAKTEAALSTLSTTAFEIHNSGLTRSGKSRSGS